ncbi:hypothetical protein BGZ98_003065 [Dissophora globulifera]|nr:hypothetical protein BGZ98_003065 [Dissophora globulifera]
MGNSASTCGNCGQHNCKIFQGLVETYNLEPQGWTCRAGFRFDIGTKSKTITMPKLVLLHDPGYQDYDKLLSLVDKTIDCNRDFRQCYLEGYFEILTTFNVDFNDYVSNNWWSTTRIYLSRAAKVVGQVVMHITQLSAQYLIGAPTPVSQIGWSY